MAEGVWQIRRRRQQHRQWRERKACLGQMVQLDGSHHDWFEGRRTKAVLMVMVDDATNLTYARFFEEETTRASFETFDRWVRRNGVPRSLYVDRDSIYRCERTATVAEQVAGQEPQTQFGRAMRALEVELILANSPQAKGRVERRNGLLQDRLLARCACRASTIWPRLPGGRVSAGVKRTFYSVAGHAPMCINPFRGTLAEVH